MTDETDPVVEAENKEKGVALGCVHGRRVEEISQRRASRKRWLEENKVIPGGTGRRKWTRLEKESDVFLGGTVWKE